MGQLQEEIHQLKEQLRKQLKYQKEQPIHQQQLQQEILQLQKQLQDSKPTTLQVSRSTVLEHLKPKQLHESSQLIKEIHQLREQLKIQLKSQKPQISQHPEQSSKESNQ